jgi:hypothetical protein
VGTSKVTDVPEPGSLTVTSTAVGASYPVPDVIAVGKQFVVPVLEVST